MIEGEEEVGSVSLWDFVQHNRERLKADALVVSDTSMLAKGVPSITYGLRGLNYYQIGDHRPGAGSCIPEFSAAPCRIRSRFLPRLIAKLHDKNFRVTVPGFYDDVAPLSPAGTQSAQLSAVERKRISQDRWAPRALTAKKDSDRRAIVDAPNSRAERHLGRLHGRRREDCDSFEGVCETFHAPRSQSEPGENRETGRAAHPQACCRRPSLANSKC